MSARTHLSKSRLMAHLQCPKRLWMQTYRPELAQEDTGSASAMAGGQTVGEVARRLHPDGVLIESGVLSQDLQDTQRLLREQPHRPLFEATFAAEGLLVRVDLLLPGDGGYRLVEVKSSTQTKPHQILDASIQAWVVRRAGVPVSSVELAHINNQFVYPGNFDYRGLFLHQDIDEEASEYAERVPQWIADAQRTLNGSEPEMAMGPQCDDPYPCPFAAHCATLTGASGQEETEYPVGLLPRHNGLAQALRDEGYADLREVPLDRLVRESHRKIWRITRDGKPELAQPARDFARSLPYPRYYLDFETIALAVPRWAQTRPYQQIPFQFSCHMELAPGIVGQTGYLSTDGQDPRRDFALALLDAVNGSIFANQGFDFDPTMGPVLVYNAAFERGRVEELAQHFPDLAERLLAVNDRMVDLLPITREHYYHPDMLGSWSLKAVLPTIGTDLSYEGMTVADGGMAQEAYLEMIDPTTSYDRSHELREALYEYCALDTYALVQLVEFFSKEP